MVHHYKDINPIITEDTEKKFLGIVQYNVTEGKIPRTAPKLLHSINL